MPIQGFIDARHLVDSIILNDFLPPAYTKWIEVKHQAVRHTRAVMPHDLLEDNRPNESDLVRDYRLNNYRAITNEGVVKFNDKTSRIINNSNFTIQNEYDDLKKWLADNEWSLLNGEQVGFREYFSRFVLPCSFEDPNATLIAFPFNPDNPETPPALPVEEGGNPSNVTIGIKTMVIPSERIRYIDERVFAWEADYQFPFEVDGKVQFAPFFFIADTEWYYRFVPIGKDDKSKIVYELQEWYFHDTGSTIEGVVTHELPINILGGTLTKDQHHIEDRRIYGKKTKTLSEVVTFNESFLKPYFEYGDEVINTLSDWQAVRTKSAYPIKVMKGVPCNICVDGTVVNGTLEDGRPDKQVCGNCKGTGMQSGTGPYADIYYEESLLKTQSNRPVIEFVAPSTDIVKYLEDAWRGLLKDAKKSVNLDVLADVVESGEAKKTRLQDTEDMLSKIAANLFDVLERYLWQVECLLVPNRSQRQKPVIIRPTRFDLKSEAMLRAEVTEAHGADKFTSLMDFFKVKYKGDDTRIKIKELAMMYAPLLLDDNVQSRQAKILSGAYSADDITKADRAEMILLKVASEMDIFESSNMQRIFDRLDELMTPFLNTTMPII